MGHGHSSHSHELGHVVSQKTFLQVLSALLFLTIVTVFVAQIDFGVMNIVVAMVIASIKATLVVLVFMHGAYENKIIWIYILLPFVLLAILIGGTFTDNPFRINPEPMKIEQTK